MRCLLNKISDLSCFYIQYIPELVVLPILLVCVCACVFVCVCSCTVSSGFVGSTHTQGYSINNHSLTCISDSHNVYCMYIDHSSAKRVNSC